MPRTDGKGIGGHTLPHRGRTDDYITPEYIIRGLGKFDLDPCQSMTQPWPCARKGYTIKDNGLKKRWFGRVYCNPPYGDEAWPFLELMADHRNGIGLIFARTETKMFRKRVWQEADAVLFLFGRLTFYRPDGTKCKGNSGGPSILIAYGDSNVEALAKCGFPGALVTKWSVQNTNRTHGRTGRI